MLRSDAIDAAITWAGAAGCLFYLWTLYRHGRRGEGPQRFLVGVLASLLLVRGFEWLSNRPILDRFTLLIAAWLPLSITLFIERVLRRHHPLWVKLWALATTGIFFVTGVFTSLTADRNWLLIFAISLSLTVTINGVLLVGRRKSDLGASENRLANLLILLAFFSAVLVLTDFRTAASMVPVRLGSIAALLFSYSMVGAASRSASPMVWLGRFLLLLGLAASLSSLLALAIQGQSREAWFATAVNGWPVSYAWMLLTGIVVGCRELSAGSAASDFLRWLEKAPLSSLDLFIASFAEAPDVGTHVLLRSEHLADYSADVLARLPALDAGIVSLMNARQFRVAAEEAVTESAEQWIDLLERTQMSHGFLACRRPLTVFLLNLPATTASAAAEKRLRVMHHLSQQIEAR